MPMRLTRAPMPSNFGITALAYLAPVSSLSGQTMTVLPASGDQSVVSSAVAAPPMAVVATMPMCINASAHFSPSTSTTVLAFVTAGR